MYLTMYIITYSNVVRDLRDSGTERSEIPMAHSKVLAAPGGYYLINKGNICRSVVVLLLCCSGQSPKSPLVVIISKAGFLSIG